MILLAFDIHGHLSSVLTGYPMSLVRNVWQYLLLTIEIIITLVILLPSVRGESAVALEWSASPDTNVAGYVIYYGRASGNYPNSINVGSVISATLPFLADGIVWYIAVTAVTDEGLESDFSNEVSYFGRIDGSNTPPFISAISDQIIYGTESLSIQLTILDHEGPSEMLVLTSSSSDSSLISTDSIRFTGSSSNRTMTVQGIGPGFGVCSITISVTDRIFTNSSVFRLTLFPPDEPAPHLDIIRLDDSVILSWPASISFWTLETSEFSPEATWSIVFDLPELIDNRNIIRVPLSERGTVFRLRK
jgi:hypothetical protein